MCIIAAVGDSGVATRERDHLRYSGGLRTQRRHAVPAGKVKAYES
ncbi:hypothetical protein RMSM_03730 [Rhodopirellula maiorica SM1]|uniref:Uncharacterized protein n=1 Tax=Rhodopirellula maiorica SM1 TaxID=1265738 RepID=M5RJ59_9BACT|nr:hypothetical protein RMSM_03730 [Rhodopirellula maiorica SM1]